MPEHTLLTMADRAAPSTLSTMDGTSVFAQVNTALIDRGLLRSPLDVTGMAESSVRALSDVLHGMIAQRVQDSDLREQLASRNRVLDASLERTKRFWKEDEEKRADCERKLEAIKAQIGFANEQASTANATLKKTREELQKTRKDLLTVKQQAAQQRQANDRHQERLRSRYTEEAIKALRTNSPQVFVAAVAGGSTRNESRHLDVNASDLIARRQIDELERRRRQMMDYNAALKRISTECLNLAKQAGEQLTELVHEGQDDADKLASSTQSNGNGSSLGAALLFQRDLFPPLNVLQADYSVVAVRGVAQHPAVVALSKISEQIEQQVRILRQGRSLRTWTRIKEARQRMRDSLSAASDEAAQTHGQDEMENKVKEPRSMQEEAHDTDERRREQQEELDRLQHSLRRALERVQHLEAQERQHQEETQTFEMARERSVSKSTTHDKDDRENERLVLQQQAAEVERQRQRYLALCRALEEQETAVAEERQRLMKEREQMTLEHSLSMVASSVGGETTQDTAIAEHCSSVGEDSRESTFTSSIRPFATTDGSSMHHRYESTPHQPMRLTTALKRPHDTSAGDKENKLPTGAATNSLGAAKRVRTDNATATKGKEESDKTGTRIIAGSEMRFITMRKQRGGGGGAGR